MSFEQLFGGRFYREWTVVNGNSSRLCCTILKQKKGKHGTLMAYQLVRVILYSSFLCLLLRLKLDSGNSTESTQFSLTYCGWVWGSATFLWRIPSNCVSHNKSIKLLSCALIMTMMNALMSPFVFFLPPPKRQRERFFPDGMEGDERWQSRQNQFRGRSDYLLCHFLPILPYRMWVIEKDFPPDASSVLGLSSSSSSRCHPFDPSCFPTDRFDVVILLGRFHSIFAPIPSKYSPLYTHNSSHTMDASPVILFV